VCVCFLSVLSSPFLFSLLCLVCLVSVVGGLAARLLLSAAAVRFWSPVPQTQLRRRRGQQPAVLCPFTSHARHVKGTQSPPLMLLATIVHTRRTLFIAPVDLSLWVGAFWCQASQCCWCGQDCRSSYSRRRIHRACNTERIEEQRNGGSHRKKARREEGTTDLLAAAAAAIASTPPMTDPTAYAIQAEAAHHKALRLSITAKQERISRFILCCARMCSSSPPVPAVAAGAAAQAAAASFSSPKREVCRPVTAVHISAMAVQMRGVRRPC
jgi:hypothetical protein